METGIKKNARLFYQIIEKFKCSINLKLSTKFTKKDNRLNNGRHLRARTQTM